jgi:GrpB-like predicted nucleotidyltransferase (UPF0157 family)
VPYYTRWPERFASERAVLATVLPDDMFIIEHIGSTAVPGLDAKPIVDMLLGAPVLAAIEARIGATEALGYEYVPEHEATLPQRRFFAEPATGPRQFHLHAVQLRDPFWLAHLLFRDALCADRGLAEEYRAMKVALAARFGSDRNGYTDAKVAFIQSVVERAGSSGLRTDVSS